MTPDELRALADALSVPHRDLATVDVIRAADYLRRCADAQPVAYRQWNSDEGYWYYGDASCAEKDDELLYTHPAPTAPHHAMLDSHRRLVEQAIQSAEHPSGMSTHDGKARIDASILRRMLAIIDSLPAVPHPSADASRDAYEGCREDLLDWKRRALKAEREARNLAKALADTVNGPTFMGEPAVPQAEPIDPHMIVADDRFPDVPAEPKREPLSDERLREVLIAEARRIARDYGEPNPESLSVIDEGMLAEVMRAGRAVERAHGIGGSDER